ncbi:MAG: HD-GYP domain-containing protein [Candidatus Tectomicrobia bacterium]|nr:HD-GYP domain-containing protein [Candidatus Tectomicrobia bacterium]
MQQATLQPVQFPGVQADRACTDERDGRIYVPLPLKDLHLYGQTDFDIYLQYSNHRFVRYRDWQTPFTRKDCERLLKNNVSTVYILQEDRDTYCEFVERNLGMLARDQTIPFEQRSKIVYDAAKFRVYKILEDPRSGNNIEKSHDLVANMVEYLLSDRMALFSVLKLLSYDYYTYTHSVNVATFSIALARALGVSEKQQLHDIGLGALLHDIGKSQISECILNKPGPLSDEEWAVMKQHPLFGLEMVKDKPSIVETSQQVIFQHHEKCDGSGYPCGLLRAEIADYAKIAAVSDVYDALTTKRCYRDAMAPYPALQLMRNQMAGHFEDEVFRRMILMLHGDLSG